MTRVVLVLTSTLLALGCASVPEVSRPDLDVATPEQWTGTDLAEGSVDPSWWESFGSAELDETIQTALERNWDLQAAVARPRGSLFGSGIGDQVLVEAVSESFGVEVSYQVATERKRDLSGLFGDDDDSSVCFL